MRCVFLLSIIIELTGAVCPDCQAQDAARDAREVARFVVTGTARGVTVPALVAVQHQKALANWKKLFSADTPPSFESDRFLLFGTVPGKSHADIAAVAE